MFQYYQMKLNLKVIPKGNYACIGDLKTRDSTCKQFNDMRFKCGSTDGCLFTPEDGGLVGGGFVSNGDAQCWDIVQEIDESESEFKTR